MKPATNPPTSESIASGQAIRTVAVRGGKTFDWHARFANAGSANTRTRFAPSMRRPMEDSIPVERSCENYTACKTCATLFSNNSTNTTRRLARVDALTIAKQHEIGSTLPQMGIGGRVTSPPRPHHRTGGSRIRRFDKLVPRKKRGLGVCSLGRRVGFTSRISIRCGFTARCLPKACQSRMASAIPSSRPRSRHY